MSNPIILSDGEDDEDKRATPLPTKKKPRTDPIPTVFLLDDDPTPPPKKPAPATSSPSPSSSIPSFVADTPMSDVPLLKSTSIRVPIHPPGGGNGGLICLDSESESESGMQSFKEHSKVGDDEEVEYTGWSPRLFSSYDSFGDANLTQTSGDPSSQPTFLQDDIYQVSQCSDKENFSLEQMGNIAKRKKADTSYNKKNSSDEAVTKKRMTKEERIRLAEEKKLKKEQEKLQKAALKAEAAELKKMEKEKQKWEKGKFALKSIVAEFDTKVVEQGSVGGHLLSRFADKGLTYRITKNPIQRSITWTMSVPEHISELSSGGTEVRYVVLVFDAEEFCNLVINGLLLDHVSKVQNHYPSYTVCYLTNRLLAYVNKREKEQYKCPENDGWRRPPIEEVLAQLTTHFVRVHYRHCTDEAELAEHLVGLTSSLASCQFRKKLTRLSVNANGSLVPKDFIDKDLIKKSPWLKALVAIPKVQPRFAVAIWKKYPTMKSLLRVYMDPNKSVHEKEFLLEDLTTEGLLGGERRVGQICSKRVYRILMAQNGSIKTDNVEDGADFFTNQSS